MGSFGIKSLQGIAPLALRIQVYKDPSIQVFGVLPDGYFIAGRWGFALVFSCQISDFRAQMSAGSIGRHGGIIANWEFYCGRFLIRFIGFFRQERQDLRELGCHEGHEDF